MLACCLACMSAAAGPPVAFPPGTSLDGSGANQTEYSALRQTFLAPAVGGRIEFDWQAFSSEFFGGGGEDVFYVRLIDPTNNSVVDAQDWALDPTPAGYSGTFTPVGAPPMGTTAPSEASAGGFGLTIDAYHLDGGTGWATAALSFPPTAADRPLSLEILVADTFDHFADTSLAIDNLRARDVTGATIASLTNPSFEGLLVGWTGEGNVGVYQQLTDLFGGVAPVAGTAPTDGKLYAVVSTGGSVPEPASLGLACLAAVATCRRSPSRRTTAGGPRL